MRGEHCTLDDCVVWLPGSSPHARGTRRARVLEDRSGGIIPACAGNTVFRRWGISRGWDHPRMRGEHWQLFVAEPVDQGSSPHARGTLEVVVIRGDEVGIIPACAGNTGMALTMPGCLRDHPRMRGEHGEDPHEFRLAEGSSPHARGTLAFRVQLDKRLGIIPACAGNTRRIGVRSSNTWDHPRMRGEHEIDGHVVCRHMGSSPHARGTRPRSDCPAVRAGIIPACAGNTDYGCVGYAIVGDHPRMRGEHLSPARMISDEMGSSPHARGTRLQGPPAVRTAGIIPACAGNTIT